MMKDQNYKIRLIEHCIGLQEQALTNIRKVMEEVEEEVAGYGPPKDRYDGFRNQQARRRSLYARQMEQAAVNLQMLRGIDPDRNYDEVAFGALVLTNDTHFWWLLVLVLFVLKRKMWLWYQLWCRFFMP
jgi:hypothetical protein